MWKTALALPALVLGLLGALSAGGARQDPSGPPAQPPDELTALFATGGVRFAPAAGALAITATVEVRDELLEYLLVLPQGAAHESAFVTEADPELLNAALLALGAEPGRNAQWLEKDPRPPIEELRAGVSPYEIVPPEGDGFYLYVAWREGDETYLYRVEDLVRDLERRRTLRRHRFVYIGSRVIQRRTGEAFAAAVEGNLVNIAYFAQGNTLLTAQPPECVKQTIWLPNAWLLPQRGAEVLMLFSRERLDAVPKELQGALPVVTADASDPPGGGGER